MSREILLMLKKVTLYDSIIGMAITTLVFIFWRNLALSLFLGLVVGIVNFIVSSMITDLLFTRHEGKHLLLYLLSFILRITFISLIGFVLFVQNRYNVLTYVGGYMIHLLGVSIYSLSQKHVN